MAESGKTRDGKDQAAIAERRRKALEFRKAGMGYPEIAQRMGLAGPGSAYKIVQAALKATYREPADDVRKLELERLDRLMLAWWQPATGRGKTADGKPAVPPDGDATDRVLRIMAQRAKLLGLDRLPPQEVSLKVNRDGNDAELDEAFKAMGYVRDEQRRTEAPDRPA